MRWLLLCLPVLFLVACSSDWVHSSKTTADFYAEDAECQAMTGGASMGIEPGTERISYESCMWDKGWRKKKAIWFFDPPFN